MNIKCGLRYNASSGEHKAFNISGKTRWEEYLVFLCTLCIFVTSMHFSRELGYLLSRTFCGCSCLTMRSFTTFIGLLNMLEHMYTILAIRFKFNMRRFAINHEYKTVIKQKNRAQRGHILFQLLFLNNWRASISKFRWSVGEWIENLTRLSSWLRLAFTPVRSYGFYWHFAGLCSNISRNHNNLLKRYHVLIYLFIQDLTVVKQTFWINFVLKKGFSFLVCDFFFEISKWGEKNRESFLISMLLSKYGIYIILPLKSTM